ncbi:lamin tail domain-containing protein [Chitinibacter bivalviorum]|uniref:Lamin tail domain-containing protein n=1 Tax=Chitinibacter bivalviorum TaxID=2739434 RepID=A0A7H9BH08_9NEIS|nr:lamin tail domain-containing protein [Chitinibacter bivalviorum]QLG88003.1 lamin tail domain-containing protein [Chitinibacter bivalviorum]
MIRPSICILSIALVACGGGGGGSASIPNSSTTAPTPTATVSVSASPSPAATQIPLPTPTAIPSTPAQSGSLVISEVSSNVYSNGVAWFEVFNTSGQAVNLNDVTVRATAGGRSSPYQQAVAPVTFTMPANTVIPAGGYLLVTGDVDSNIPSSSQVARIRNGDNIPTWGSSGFIELVSGGKTLDVVRFGSNTDTPTTAGAWGATNAEALTAVEYGRSLVRDVVPGQNTVGTGTVWRSVAFSTPLGKNDVPANAIDQDGDGIPTYAKAPGQTFGGINYYDMGARPGQKDVFIQVNWMKTLDPGVLPRKEALQQVVNAFAPHGIAIHFDVGGLFNPNFSPADFNLGGGRSVPYAQCIGLGSSGSPCPESTIYAYKAQYFDAARLQTFHFLLMANSQLSDGSAGSSGVAELGGNDLLLTMGNWGFVTTAGTGLNQLVNMQAATIMHELGHNLGLNHGGGDGINYKPNYLSVMNYLYSLYGTGSGSDSFRQRYLGRLNNTDPCSYSNGPCAANMPLNFSDGSGGNLNEADLSDTQTGIGRGLVNLDWNNNGTNQTHYSYDVNDDGQIGVLSDYNDWANLQFAFARNLTGNMGSSRALSKSSSSANPVLNDRQKHIVDPAPDFRVLQMIRSR